MHDQSEDYSLSHAYRILGHELVFSRNLPQYQFSVYYNQHNDLASEFYSSRNWSEWYNNVSSDYVIDHEYEHKSTMLTTSGMNAIAYGVYSNILALILLLFNLKHSAKLACKRTPISWTTYIKKKWMTIILRIYQKGWMTTMNEKQRWLVERFYLYI